MAKYAVLVVDMINEFVTGNLGCERGLAIVPKVEQLVKQAREKDIPVIFCCDAHVPGGVDGELKLWGEHAIAGTSEAQVIPEIAPLPGEHVILKRRYSGFFGTSLDMLLRELGVDTVIVCGLLVNLCIQHTVADAYCLGYDTVVPRDTTDAIDESVYNYCMDYFKMAYGSTLTDVDSLMASI